MNKFTRKPKQIINRDVPAKFQKFNLLENPFPSEPVVNKDSADKRINGEIFEFEIRKKEYTQVVDEFLKKPQTDPNHFRLGYIIDTSYIGRGNGKSAFLVNLNHNINKEFCLDISDDVNKCFSAIVTPEPGGRTKTFPIFVDLIFKTILNSNIIDYALSIIRYEAINTLYPSINLDALTETDYSFINSLRDIEWYRKQGIDYHKICDYICQIEMMQGLPPEFPVFESRRGFFFENKILSQDNFENYYFSVLKSKKDKLDFVFTHLIRLFQSAAFNGTYILVDDFERIPDFQSARQKKDFALELRSCLFDGMYLNSRIGFYNFLLVLHAGVPRLISDAWTESGLENRSPISHHTASKHIILFEKLNKSHASMLLKRYLDEYRINRSDSDTEPLFPFSEEAITYIGQKCEFNASKMLKTAYDLLDKAADISIEKIDEQFVMDQLGGQEDLEKKNALTIEDAETTDLVKKATDTE